MLNVSGRPLEPTQADRARKLATFQMRPLRQAVRLADRPKRARQEQPQRDQVQLL
jgi:hypothetical protein